MKGTQLLAVRRLLPDMLPGGGASVALVAIDLGARLAVPASLIALAHGFGHAALAAAVAVSLLAMLRGLLSGRALECAVVASNSRLVQAAARYEATRLHTRPGRQRVAALLEGARREAQFRAVVAPRLAADSIGLGLVGGLIVWRLSWSWLALGAATFCGLGALVVVAQRSLRRVLERAWKAYAEVAYDIDVLTEAAVELRAHGRQEALVVRLVEGIREMSRSERQASTHSALVGLFPLGVALAVVAVPQQLGLRGLSQGQSATHVAEAGVLGATALVLGLGLVQGAEAIVRSGPGRRLLAAFIAGSGLAKRGPVAAPAPAAAQPDLRDAEIVFDAVSIRYPEATDFTPFQASLRWPPGRGLAVTGENGAGKSSLLLAMLGLVEPAEGEIRYGALGPAELDWQGPGRQVVFVPQHAFVAASSSVAWNLRLLAGDEPSNEELAKALRRVGLYEVLDGHARARKLAPLDVPAGELSGGERRRLHLARALLGEPALVLLDEPEAGLDEPGRLWLRELLAELSRFCRVLLVAHDPSVIPEGFERLRCERRPAESAAMRVVGGAAT
ncbi:MAG: ATP-binding cassette domain-containing protein [Deltaproteobacteria bacterium]|nr:ATP-binding cassette domain-containing protein [Deltaproteobacteria bacterium]